MICDKHKYRTEKEAEIALQYIKSVPKRFKREKFPIRHYFCDYCKHYHLTSKPANQESIKLIYFDKFLTLIRKSRSN